MFMWVVLFHDLSSSTHLLGTGAMAAGMMTLIISSRLREPVLGEVALWASKRSIHFVAVVVGVAVGLAIAGRVSSLAVAITAVIVQHALAGVGIWILACEERREHKAGDEPGGERGSPPDGG